ncbi:MAG TPA: rod shape-determining protein MreD [Acidimicrobiales bacterium]|nr:rod shape-determining protein MreD [Acidimicrobiales bacterium]
MTSRLRLAIVLLLALTLHQSLFVTLRVDDAHPQVMLLVAVAGGLLAGAERGALIGFAAGLLADLFVQTPLGLSALTFALVGFVVGSLQTGIVHTAWWIAPVTALLASFSGILLYGVLGAIIGQSHFVSPRLVIVAAGVGAMNAALAVPIVRAMAWALDTRADRSYAG